MAVARELAHLRAGAAIGARRRTHAIHPCCAHVRAREGEHGERCPWRPRRGTVDRRPRPPAIVAAQQGREHGDLRDAGPRGEAALAAERPRRGEDRRERGACRWESGQRRRRVRVRDHLVQQLPPLREGQSTAADVDRGAVSSHRHAGRHRPVEDHESAEQGIAPRGEPVRERRALAEACDEERTGVGAAHEPRGPRDVVDEAVDGPATERAEVIG